MGKAHSPLAEPDVRISRIRLSCEQSTGTTRRNQITQTKLTQMCIKTNAFRHTIRALAAPSKMKAQTSLHVIIEIPVSLTRISELKIGGPTLEIPIDVFD